MQKLILSALQQDDDGWKIVMTSSEVETNQVFDVQSQTQTNFISLYMLAIYTRNIGNRIIDVAIP